MPNKPRLPTNARRLPKGTRRADYEDEVLLAYDRNRWRRSQRAARLRRSHDGRRDVCFRMDKPTRDKLARAAKALGITKTRLLERLVQTLPEL